MSSANVTSLDALRQFRAALIKYEDTARETITGLDMELRRGMQWLLETQPQFWHNETRRLSDRVLEARVELSRCRSNALPGEVAPCSEQKHALERAIAQLRHAEDKVKLTKHWGRVVEHESHEWQGRSNQFASLLEREVPNAIALLDRAITALEAYTMRASGGSSSPAPAAATPAPPSLESPDASR